MKRLIWLLTALFAAGPALLPAQSDVGGAPLCILEGEVAAQLEVGIEAYELPTLDNDVEQERAQQYACELCNYSYYGSGIDVDIDLKQNSTQMQFEDGSKLWLLKLTSQTAYGMQFYFDEFRLPEGARLFVYSPETETFLGAYTSANNNADQSLEIQFGIRYIEGKEIILEYYEPADVNFGGQINLTNVVHIFQNVFTAGGPHGTASDCHTDAFCSFGWEEEIASVALILAYDDSANMVNRCSGALINNTDEDGRPLFLTANHCIDGVGSKYDYSTWQFLFHHELDDCNGTYNALRDESVYGSKKLVADYDDGSEMSDYLLLELTTTAAELAQQEVCYAGWTLDENPDGTYTSFHHPRGDLKKISEASNIATRSGSITLNTKSGSRTFPGNSHWELDWDSDNQTTEPGSSGGPLFDNKQRIIGQGTFNRDYAFTYCFPNLIAGYGKFNKSWTDGGLDWWLDPYNTGQTAIDTYCPPDPIDNNPPPTGGGPAPCKVWQGNGMKINGDTDFDSFPCVGDDIVLSPYKDGDCQTYWAPGATESKYNCGNIPGNLNSGLCKKRTVAFWQCRCYYFKYFLEVAEVDQSKNVIGSVHNAWLNLQVEAHSADWGPNKDYYFFAQGVFPYIYLYRMRITPGILSQIGVTLQPGRFYKIKFATDYGGWREDTRFFRYAPQNVNRSGVISGDLYAEDFITLSDATVTQPIDVVAGQKISILETSSLQAGHYRIEDGTLCGLHKFGVSDREESPGPGWNPGVSIYPNPTGGRVEVDVSEFDGEVVVELVDRLGRSIMQIHTKDRRVELDLSGQSSGMYYLRISDGAATVTTKVVKL